MRGEGGSKAGASPRPCYWHAKNGSGSIAEEKTTPRPPANRPRPAVTVRIPTDVQTAITARIDLQPDPKPSRSEAIRRLIEKGLKSD